MEATVEHPSRLPPAGLPMASGIRLATRQQLVDRARRPRRVGLPVAQRAAGMVLSEIPRPVRESPEVSPARATKFGRTPQPRGTWFLHLAPFRIFAAHSAV